VIPDLWPEDPLPTPTGEVGSAEWWRHQSKVKVSSMAQKCERCGYPPESWLRIRRVGSGRLMRLCELCIEDDNREPGEPDGEAFRGGEAAAFARDQQDAARRMK
jgi:hypothetical protein